MTQRFGLSTWTPQNRFAWLISIALGSQSARLHMHSRIEVHQSRQRLIFQYCGDDRLLVHRHFAGVLLVPCRWAILPHSVDSNRADFLRTLGRVLPHRIDNRFDRSSWRIHRSGFLRLLRYGGLRLWRLAQVQCSQNRRNCPRTTTSCATTNSHSDTFSIPSLSC